MMTYGPPELPPPELQHDDYCEVQPPCKTRAQVTAERRAAKLASWPFNVDIACPECGMVFRLKPGADHRLYITADRTQDTHVCYVNCPNCPPSITYNIKLVEPRQPSWWQRLWRQQRDG